VTPDTSDTNTNSGAGSITISWIVSVPTTLTATPAIAQLSGLKIYLFGLNGTLTANGAPVSGQTITFTVGGTTICSAVTNSAGTASCNGIASALSIILANGYKATFAGNPPYLPSSTTAPLITF
jgi:hypothetical protein